MPNKIPLFSLRKALWEPQRLSYIPSSYLKMNFLLHNESHKRWLSIKTNPVVWALKCKNKYSKRTNDISVKNKKTTKTNYSHYADNEEPACSGRPASELPLIPACQFSLWQQRNLPSLISCKTARLEQADVGNSQIVPSVFFPEPPRPESRH